MAEIVVVGSTIIDLTTYLPGAIPAYGFSTNVDKCEVDFGGNGANQAVMPRLLGAQVAFVGKVGNDVFGKMYRDHFAELGIDTSSLGVSETALTGASQVMVHEQTGQYAAVGYLGANLEMSMQDVLQASELIAGCKCLIVSLETPFHVTLEALRIAKKHGAKTVFNPSPMSYIAKLRASQAEYDEFLRLADIVCPNEYEAAELTDAQLAADGDDAAFGTFVTRALEQMHNEVCRVGNGNATLLTTLGARGVAFWNDRTGRVHVIATDRVQAVDSTGAGDCFVGALGYFAVRHAALPTEELLRRAAYIATLSVTRRGTQKSYPTRNQLPNELFH